MMLSKPQVNAGPPRTGSAFFDPSVVERARARNVQIGKKLTIPGICLIRRVSIRNGDHRQDSRCDRLHCPGMRQIAARTPQKPHWWLGISLAGYAVAAQSIDLTYQVAEKGYSGAKTGPKRWMLERRINSL